jgi:hypothetical protein
LLAQSEKDVLVLIVFMVREQHVSYAVSTALFDQDIKTGSASPGLDTAVYFWSFPEFQHAGLHG